MSVAKNEDDAPVSLSLGMRPSNRRHRTSRPLCSRLRTCGEFIAFLGIILYFGYGNAHETIAEIFAVRGTLAQRLVLYASPFALLGVATVLLLGLWNMVVGRSANTSRTHNARRIVLEFIALCLVMASLFLSVRN